MVYKQKGSENWWYKFTWNGKKIRESTKQPNKRVAEQIEAAHRAALAKGEVGIRDKEPTPTLKEFARESFLPFVTSTKAAKPTLCASTRTASRTSFRSANSRTSASTKSPRSMSGLRRPPSTRRGGSLHDQSRSLRVTPHVSSRRRVGQGEDSASQDQVTARRESSRACTLARRRIRVPTRRPCRRRQDRSCPPEGPHRHPRGPAWTTAAPTGIPACCTMSSRSSSIAHYAPRSASA